jgi:hypothetical protein
MQERPFVCRCGWRYASAEDLAGHLDVSNTSHWDATPLEPADNCEGQDAAYEESTEPGAFPVMGDPWAPGHDTEGKR